MGIKNPRQTGTGMVDITEKESVLRIASASGVIHLKPATISAITRKKVPKGDVLTVAEVAAINAVKETPNLLFHCHQIPITNVDVNFNVGEDKVTATVKVQSIAKTGVEMEALTGVTTVLLTIWDMVKAFEKDEGGQYPTAKIADVRVIEKVKK